jgi:AcrR family transcriptional regulator
MGRRSDHSKDELYEMALAAARRIIEVDGLRALTARNVADVMGYSPGTLYNLFENLDDLIVHLNGRLLDELHDDLLTVDIGEEARENLFILLGRYLAFIENNENLWSLLFEHTMPEGQPAPDWYRRKVGKVLAIVESAIAPAFEPGNTIRPMRSARVLWASLHGIWSLTHSGKLALLTDETTTELAETLIATYLAGLRVTSESTDV